MFTNLVSKCVQGTYAHLLKTAGGDDNSSRKTSRKTSQGVASTPLPYKYAQGLTLTFKDWYTRGLAR